jgi:RNA polymerase sigma factor (sigma-70 family)
MAGQWTSFACPPTPIAGALSVLPKSFTRWDHAFAWDDSVIDPIRLREIWNAHSDRVTLIARAMADPTDSQNAEDAVQEAFISLATQTALPDDPLAWLVRVTRNQLLQWRRSHGRRQRREHNRHNHCEPATTWLTHPQLAIDRQLDARAVTEALVQLPEDQRQIIVMHLWGEMTFERIAGVLNMSRSSVHRLYGRGLEQLKQRFNPDEPADQALSILTHSNEPDTVIPRR